MSTTSALARLPEHRGLAQPEERGRLVIADKVVERIARHAANELPGSVASGTRWSLPIIGSAYPKVSARIAGSRARITVEVASPWPVPAPVTAASVRDRVAEQVARLTGIVVEAVDVTVAEIVYVEAAQRRVE